jgi:hypothetical protein
MVSETGFSYFKKLPLELRLRIWELGVEARTLIIQRDVPEAEWWDHTRGWKILMPHTPAILHVDRESRSYATTSHRKLLPASMKHNPYFNPHLDTVYLCTPPYSIAIRHTFFEDNFGGVVDRMWNMDGEMESATGYLCNEGGVKSLALDLIHLGFGLPPQLMRWQTDDAKHWVDCLCRISSLKRLVFIEDGGARLTGGQDTSYELMSTAARLPKPFQSILDKCHSDACEIDEKEGYQRRSELPTMEIVRVRDSQLPSVFGIHPSAT